MYLLYGDMLFDTMYFLFCFFAKKKRKEKKIFIKKSLIIKMVVLLSSNPNPIFDWFGKLFTVGISRKCYQKEV